MLPLSEASKRMVPPAAISVIACLSDPAPLFAVLVTVICAVALMPDNINRTVTIFRRKVVFFIKLIIS